MNTKNAFTLHHLLEWLDADPSHAGRKYVELHKELTAYLAGRGAHISAEALADEALVRVDRRLSTALLSEHHNATEIRDVLGICRAIRDGGASNSPGPGRRVWELLPDSARQLVAAIARAGDFERTRRGLVSKALNVVLCRRDFYRAEDFETATRHAEGPLAWKIEAGLRGGLEHLQQHEVEMFNRRLLAAVYPTMVEAHLSDAPEKDRLPRCKHFARLVLIEYLRTGGRLDALPPEAGEPSKAERLRDVASRDPLADMLAGEEAAERRRMLDCVEECKRRKLSPRDRVLLDKYFTGVEVLSPDDEPLSGREIKEIRKSLADELGVVGETIRTLVHRSRKVVLDCVVRCMRRGGKF